MSALATLQLYMRTVRHLRGAQLRQMLYRRLLRPRSRPHAALDRSLRRRSAAPAFAPPAAGKELDRLGFAAVDFEPGVRFEWQASGAWQPLRYQLHYFEYLHDPQRLPQWKRAILNDWIERNPCGAGDGWIAYAVSLRIVNWIKFFVAGPPAEVEPRWLASLYDHALWLETNLERHILANHYLKNAKALLFAGLFFSGPDADRWQARGTQIFFAQMREQFLADGGHYERSPMYHALAVEDVLDVFAYLASGAAAVEAAALETLRARAVAGLDFLAALVLPGGGLPRFNDSADGVALEPEALFAYARATLGYESPRIPGGLLLRALAASGYYVVRERNDMLVIDCGPLGPCYQPGHAHCDLLSYELAFDGERVVVDAGVLDYENNAARRYARGTAAHNTVTVDGRDQAQMWDVFRLARRARPLAASLALTGPGRATFSGAHDGFRRAPGRAVHRRTVCYERGAWSFEDRLDGTGRHRVESRVHVDPALSVRPAAGGVRIARADGRQLAELRIAPGLALALETAAHYPRFGTSRQGSVVVMSWEGELPATLSYVITSPAAR